jgi:hypothetical protein
MSQNAVTTRSARKESPCNPPSSYDATKTTSNTQKTHEADNQSTPSTPPSKLDYDFLEDLKRTKENISLFELMKLLQIQENFIKTLQVSTSKNTSRR